jgi:hypothetical protein
MKKTRQGCVFLMVRIQAASCSSGKAKLFPPRRKQRSVCFFFSNKENVLVLP